MLVNQWFAGRVRAADWVAHAASLFGVARFAWLGFEFANHEAAAITVGIELAVGSAVAAAG